ncbi:hypothetical protein HPO_17445 [Hyphomonas polymorpha PS728]|uniref:IrrE N-terminal-like domain-containing protein n=1 Tax=Hyphomonas polymorpha PS728 TaxID=1280954 RepID=A0A062V4U0_9PROT|nr:hypothetical protein [Hyphomonas polymorpha]KCZ96956.1 hypothetical protein HPO_17445 [Hyphomonas polymorpha PS728]
MPFSDLLDHVDAGAGNRVIVDADIVPKLKELTGQDKVYFVPADLDTAISFGHVKRYREHDVPYGQPLWVTEVRFSNKLNTCWRRFVCCKELMHAFDAEHERADTAEKFLQLLNELELPPPTPSGMLVSEARAVWSAMAVLAPARLIAPLSERYKAGDISDYEVALALRVPEFYVPHIMEDAFPRIVQRLRNET